jgi:hypothetical protein
MRMIAFLSLHSPSFPPRLLRRSRSTVPTEITRLERCIQARFLDRKVFGMNRIGTMPAATIRTHHIRSPTACGYSGPESGRTDRGGSVAAKAARSCGVSCWPWDFGSAALSDTWRAFRGTRIRDTACRHAAARRRGVVVRRKDRVVDDWGRSWVGGEKGEWTIAMRPLRASNQSSIQCHATVGAAPKPGDALGVAIYVYRHSIKADTPQLSQSPPL